MFILSVATLKELDESECKFVRIGDVIYFTPLVQGKLVLHRHIVAHFGLNSEELNDAGKIDKFQTRYIIHKESSEYGIHDADARQYTKKAFSKAAGVDESNLLARSIA